MRIYILEKCLKWVLIIKIVVKYNSCFSSMVNRTLLQYEALLDSEILRVICALWTYHNFYFLFNVCNYCCIYAFFLCFSLCVHFCVLYGISQIRAAYDSRTSIYHVPQHLIPMHMEPFSMCRLTGLKFKLIYVIIRHHETDGVYKVTVSFFGRGGWCGSQFNIVAKLYNYSFQVRDMMLVSPKKAFFSHTVMGKVASGKIMDLFFFFFLVTQLPWTDPFH